MNAAGGVVAALRFLTVLPLPRRGFDGPGTAAFPAVGLLVGGAAAAALALPLPDLARAALALALGVGLTGGLHEDAWIDACDAAFAPGGRARRVAVLSDPRAGAHGVTGLAVVLLLRLAALAAVAPAAAAAAAVVGRWSMVAAARALPTLRPGGLGAWFREQARPAAATGVAAACLVLVGALGGGEQGARGGAVLGAAAWASGAAAGMAWGRLLASRLGGLNGDGLGAVGVAAEVGALWGAVVARAAGAGW